MADNTLSSWAPFLYELKGKVVEVFPSEAPFLAEMSGYDAKAGAVDHHSTVRRISKEMDGGREIFSGKFVRHTIILAGLPMGGNPTENSTWNTPVPLSSTEAHINLVRFLVPFTVTVDVERDSFDNSSATAVAQLIQQARTALARLENLEYMGDGTGLNGTITDGATSLTTTISATDFNPDVLLPGTIWDIRTRASGADPGQGTARLIASVNESTRVVTWDTNAQIVGGGSGNIVHTSADGIYVQGSYTASASAGSLVAQGLQQVAAASGTFENINKANVPQWQGTDGRVGDTNVLPLSPAMMDTAVRRGRRTGLGTWDFGLGDPAAIDLFKQQLYALVRYEPQVDTLKSGFSGIVYDGADKPFPFIKEPMHLKATVRLIDKDSFVLYGDQAGPSFLEDDGSMFRRLNRSLPKEADMLDRTQLGVTKCNTLVTLGNLAVS